MKCKTIKFSDMTKDYNLNAMRKFYTFRFSKCPPKGYKLYVTNNGLEGKTSYSLRNDHKLYYKVKND